MNRRVFLTMAATALSLSTSVAVAQDTVKLGIIFPLSGGSGPNGKATVDAATSMVNLINANGGVLGRQIETIVRDDEGTPAVGVARANELVSMGVDAVIEGWNSPVALAMQPIFNRAGIFDLTSNAQADAILSGEGNPLAVRLNSSGARNGEATANYIKEKGWSKIGLLVQNDAYGESSKNALIAALDEAGIEYEVSAEQSFPMDQLDFRGPFTTLRAAQPDAIIFWNASTAAGVPALIRSWKQMKIEIPLVAAAGVIVESTVDTLGDKADGVFSLDFYFAKSEPVSTIPQNRDFIAQVQKDHGFTPDKYNAMGAMAVQLWAMAANEVGSLEKEPIANFLRGKKVPNTILGDVEFAENGQLIAPFYYFQVQDGKIVIEK